jgi:hypothetical protein
MLAIKNLIVNQSESADISGAVEMAGENSQWRWNDVTNSTVKQPPTTLYSVDKRTNPISTASNKN